MQELSMHILDIAQNSIAAGANLITLRVLEDPKADRLEFSVKDNGCGMSPEMVAAVTDPFTTSRSTRKVGLGIPLLKYAAECTGGGLIITSQVKVGTELRAWFGYSHIDRQPLGDMAGTMLGLVTAYENIDFVYTHQVEEREFTFDTREMKEILGGVSLTQPEVLLWLKDFLSENEAALVQGESAGQA